MNTLAEVRRRCVEVCGPAMNPSRRTVNRVICYRDDCQAFAHQLGRADLFDARGGTDIAQVAPASLKFIQGQRRIVGPLAHIQWPVSVVCELPQSPRP